MNEDVTLNIVLKIILIIIISGVFVIFGSFLTGWIIIKLLSLLNVLKMSNYSFWKIVLVGFLFDLILGLINEIFRKE
jgi:hypothetical protein